MKKTVHTTGGSDVNKFLKLESLQQGPIKGSVTQPGKEGLIGVLYFSHEITDPIVQSLSTPFHVTGGFVFGTLAVIKMIDRSTPLLYKALSSGEKIKTFNLAFYVKTPTGQEVKQFTIDLIDAQVSNINQAKQNSNSTPDLMKFAEFEEVQFVYQSIKWSWIEGINIISHTITVPPPR